MPITIQTERPGRHAVICHEYRTSPRNLVHAIHVLRQRAGRLRRRHCMGASRSWLEVDHRQITQADMEFVVSRATAGTPLQKARDLLASVRDP